MCRLGEWVRPEYILHGDIPYLVPNHATFEPRKLSQLTRSGVTVEKDQLIIKLKKTKLWLVTSSDYSSNWV